MMLCPPTPLSNPSIRHTRKLLIRLAVCVCHSETVRDCFQRTERTS